MPRVTLRIDLFALYDEEDPRLYAGSIFRDNVTFAVLPQAGDNVRGLKTGGSLGLPEHYRVSFLEHWPALEAPLGADDEGVCWVVCQGPWPKPGESEEYAFRAVAGYEASGWRIHLEWEVERRFRSFREGLDG